MIEIERKFKVSDVELCLVEAYDCSVIRQGYLSFDPERTVRIRIKNKKAFLTIKGCADSSGTTRFEWEKEIDVAEAERLMLLSKGHTILKKRYHIQVANHCFEVDVFEGMHLGLVIAEIELRDKDEFFVRPHWLGDEVTGDTRYYNSYLAKGLEP